MLRVPCERAEIFFNSEVPLGLAPLMKRSCKPDECQEAEAENKSAKWPSSSQEFSETEIGQKINMDQCI